jgi:hypothetical protein
VNAAETARAGAVAHVVHDALRAHQIQVGEPAAPPWIDAHEDHRQSLIATVHSALTAMPTTPAPHDALVTVKLAVAVKKGETAPKDQTRRDALFQSVVGALK